MSTKENLAKKTKKKAQFQSHSSGQELNEHKPDIAVIAGGGGLPAKLIHACDRKNITPFIVGFEGQTDESLIKGRYHLWTRLGAAAQIIRTLKANDITEIVLIGSVRRPSLDELRPDWKTAQLLTKIGFKAFGDDGLLQALRKELEREGFTIKGIQDFVDDLLAVEGQYGNFSPDKDEWCDIEKGVKLCKLMGKLDVGQGCVVQQGIVLGIEAVEGTDALIKRSGELKRKGSGGVLVKVSKPGQDKTLDLPTIGPDTITHASNAGLKGIIVESGHTLMINPQEMTDAANKAGMFLVGVTLDDNGDILNKK